MESVVGNLASYSFFCHNGGRSWVWSHVMKNVSESEPSADGRFSLKTDVSWICSEVMSVWKGKEV